MNESVWIGSKVLLLCI